MIKQRLSDHEVVETFEHLILGFSSVTNVDDLTPKEIDKANVRMQDILGDVPSSNASRIKRLPREMVSKTKPVSKMSHEEFEKKKSKLTSKQKSLLNKYGSVSRQVFLCDFCIYVLKKRLKHLNSLTKPVIKGFWMKKEPGLLNLKEITDGIYNVFAHQKLELKDIIEREKSKLEYLKGLKAKKRKTDKRKKKENLKSLFFKRRGDLKASLVEKGKKNAECMLRAYELFTLKIASKTGRVLHSQEEVANALIEEGLAEKCSQQSVSRWNNVVERELRR